jgi:CBS domain-containing protein
MPVLVKDIMTKKVFVIDPNKTAKDAGILMKKIRRGCLVVTEDNRPIGIVTDSDLIRKIISNDLVASKIKVKDIMSKPLVTVEPDDDILVAVRKMRKSNIHRLPVISGEKLVGIISLRDIAVTSPEMLDLLEYRLKMKEMPFEIKEEFTASTCDSCGNYSDRLKNVNGQWLCETCREELEE